MWMYETNVTIYSVSNFHYTVVCVVLRNICQIVGKILCLEDSLYKNKKVLVKTSSKVKIVW